MLDDMMDMSLSTLAIIALVLLLVIVGALLLTLRILGGRAHQDDGQTQRTRMRRGPKPSDGP